jgi:class 3 adenylate cyclase
MGLALLRARYLDAQVRQLAVWDRGPAHGAAGTAIDVATWRRRGGAVTVVAPTADPPPGASPDVTPSLEMPARVKRDGARVVRAMLFADISGFSQLTDEATLIFAERVFGAFATVLQQHRSHISGRRTWGDALFLVFTDAPAAASCALDLQDAMAGIDLEAEGLPRHLALRLGGHLGPIFRYHDPIIDAPDFTGSHVTRTARIEPVTPTGAVYVTEPFAAALVLAGRSDLTCDYVGHMSMAKSYGRLRMYRLRRRTVAARP